MRAPLAAFTMILTAGCSAPSTKQFASAEQKVRFAVPAGWNRAIEEGPERGLSGADGYVKVSAMAGSPTVADACRADAFHRMQPYGPQPRVESVVIDRQPGCRIVPTVRTAVEDRIPAGLILKHPRPVELEPRHVHTRPYPYLVIWVDPRHLGMVERSLRFIR